MDDQNKPIEHTEDNQAENVGQPENVANETPSVSSAAVVNQLPAKTNRRRLVLIVLAVVAVIAGGLAAYMLMGSGEDEPTQSQTEQKPNIGVAVSLIDGAATYKSSNGDWQELATTSELKTGDFVSTDATGRVVLTFDDGSAIRLDAATTVQLTSLVADHVTVTQNTGIAYSRVVESDRVYEVVVDETSYQALGTAFTTINETTEKGVKVLQSSVSVSGLEEAVAEGKQYFVENANEELKLKQTDINLDDIKSDSFMLWNLEQDENDQNFKEKLGVWQTIKEQEAAVETPAEAEPAPTAALRLSARNNDEGTVLSWSVTGVNTASGFKIVRSKSSSSPTFGKDEARYISSSGARQYTWKSEKSGTFWYRVCAYRPDSGSCVNYSNAVQMEAVYVPPTPVTRGAVTLSKSGEMGLTWSFAGTAQYGFKVLISNSENPIYPNNSVAYVGEASFTVKDEHLSPGDNFIRVCKYTNGSESEHCVDYSNQVVITKP